MQAACPAWRLWIDDEGELLGCLLTGVIGEPHGEGVRPGRIGVPASWLLASRGPTVVCRVVSLLTDDVWLIMPPSPFEYQGRDVARRGLTLLFGRGLRYRLVATRANGQPAFGVYVHEPGAPAACTRPA